MAWYEIIAYVVGSVGGIGGFLSFYTAKPSKTRMEIDNLRAIIEEEKNERISLREEYNEYKIETNEKFNALKIEHNRNERAILTAYKCDKIKKANECPVISSLENEENE